MLSTAYLRSAFHSILLTLPVLIMFILPMSRIKTGTWNVMLYLHIRKLRRPPLAHIVELKDPYKELQQGGLNGPKYLRRALELIDDLSAVLSRERVHELLVVDGYDLSMHADIMNEFRECQHKRRVCFLYITTII